jgi:hypothetical protein
VLLTAAVHASSLLPLTLNDGAGADLAQAR